MPTVAVLGAGFAALNAVEALRAGDKDIDIVLVAPKPEFVFLPSLIWMPSGLRKAQDLIVPLEGFFARSKVRYHQGEVTGLADGGRVVKTSNGDVSNDYLIIACGGRFIRKLPGIENAILPCGGVEAGQAIHDRLRDMDGGTIAMGFAGNPNEPSGMRGGPVFEYLFGIDRLLRKQGRRGKFDMVFFSPAAEPGKRMGAQAVPRLLAKLAKHEIRTHLGHKMKGFEEKLIKTEGGDVPADMITFMPGMTGNAWFDDSDLPRSPGGFIQADANCKVPGTDNIWVAGDAGSFPGPEWLPKQAHMAELQAKAAANNLLGTVHGGKTDHTYRTELVCILDTLDKGMLVARTEKRVVMLPPMRLLHWTKRVFERQYMNRYR